MSRKPGVSNGDLSDDSYVAELLAREARDSSLTYSTIGLAAYMPKRPTSNAPKPNTRFLRNIIRETDSHNAALKRKEEQEARERMRQLRGDASSHSHSTKPRRDSVRVSDERRTRRRDDDEDDHGHRRRHRTHDRRHRDRSTSSERDRLPKHRRRHDVRDRKDGERHSSSRKERRTDREEREHSSHKDKRDMAPSRSRSRSPRRDRSSERRSRPRQDRYHSDDGSRLKSRSDKTHSRHPQDHQNPHGDTTEAAMLHRNASDDESDPLEDLVGPLPPTKERPATAPVRSRGRGAYRSNASNIDAHFAPDYDPALDVHLQDEDDDPATRSVPSRRPVSGLMTGDGDDWDLALEALRDRAHWKQQGAERLRQAGFNDSVVERWKSTATSTGRSTTVGSGDSEGRVEEVQWAKKGEGREWDRGKVIDDDGHVDVKAPW